MSNRIDHLHLTDRVRKTTSPFPLTSGFTLVEMAMVLVIIGLIILSVFPALRAMQTANARALTQSNLRSLMNATAAFTQANGCLPCPGNPSSPTYIATAFGKLGYASTTAACGTCSSPEGIPPFAALGLPMSVAHDGWGHWITMRVDPALTASFGVTPPDAPCASVNAFGCSAVNNEATQGLCKTGLSKTNSVMVTVPNAPAQPVAVIFVSHGRDGYGSLFAEPFVISKNGTRLSFPPGFPGCAPPQGYAACNARNTVNFYDAPAVISDTDPYDDQMLYADRNALVSMLGNPACQTTW